MYYICCGHHPHMTQVGSDHFLPYYFSTCCNTIITQHVGVQWHDTVHPASCQQNILQGEEVVFITFASSLIQKFDFTTLLFLFSLIESAIQKIIFLFYLSAIRNNYKFQDKVRISHYIVKFYWWEIQRHTFCLFWYWRYFMKNQKVNVKTKS